MSLLTTSLVSSRSREKADKEIHISWKAEAAHDRGYEFFGESEAGQGATGGDSGGDSA